MSHLATRFGRRPISIGAQNFADVRNQNCFYVDKADFIRQWWLSTSPVTLIDRPRRFGKTLMINTVESFFSNAYSDQETLFAGLELWKDARMRRLAGAFPVVKLSFSSLKSATPISFQNLMVKTICSLYQQYPELKKSPALSDEERTYYGDVIRWEVERKTALPAGSERRALMVVAAFSVR